MNAAPSTDLFKPPESVTYSRSRVKKAGRAIRKFYESDYRPDVKDIETDAIDRFLEAITIITWWRMQHAAPLKRVAAGLRYHVEKAEAQLAGRVDVTQRLKRRETIMQKLQREPTMALTNMHDIAGVRAVLPSLDHVYAVSRRLKKNWKVASTRDYINGPPGPKPSGYRAVHLGIERDDFMVEVQLRTWRQDAWANQVENDGRDLGVGFKFGSGHDDVHEYYRVVGEAFEILDRGFELNEDLVDALNRSYDKVADQLGRR